MATIFENAVTFLGEVSIENATSITLPAAAVVNATVSSTAAIDRSKLAQETKTYNLPFENFRVHDAFGTLLPGTSSSDDLGLYGGTYGTNTPRIATYDVKTLSTTLYARTTFTLPAEYDAAQAVTIRIKGAAVTTVASTTLNVDVECRKSNNEGGLGSDICATSAQSINNLSYTNRDFTITPTGLAAGDVLDIRISIIVVDAATGTAVIGSLGVVQALVAVRG